MSGQVLGSVNTHRQHTSPAKTKKKQTRLFIINSNLDVLDRWRQTNLAQTTACCVESTVFINDHVANIIKSPNGLTITLGLPFIPHMVRWTSDQKMVFSLWPKDV